MGASRSRRAALAALVLPALVLAAIAARSHRPFTGESGGDRDASSLFVDSVFTVAAVLLVALVGVLVWTRLTVGKRAKPGEPPRFSLGAFLLYLVVITVAFFVLRHGLEKPRPVPEGEENADPAFPQLPVPNTPTRPGEPTRGPQFMWPLAGGVAALIAAAVVTAVLVARRRREDGEGPSTEEIEALGAALDEALEDLRTEPDPRRAVVAAYARMERALTVFGLPRHPSEAPYEYLRRIGRELEAERAVSSLTELFELAKFSSHPVDEPMRGRAVDALSAVRDEVRKAA